MFNLLFEKLVFHDSALYSRVGATGNELQLALPLRLIFDKEVSKLSLALRLETRSHLG